MTGGGEGLSFQPPPLRTNPTAPITRHIAPQRLPHGVVLRHRLLACRLAGGAQAAVQGAGRGTGCGQGGTAAGGRSGGGRAGGLNAGADSARPVGRQQLVVYA